MPDLTTFLQLTVTGLVNGASYGMLGVGFALIIGVTGRFHFAYGLGYTLAAYACWWLSERAGLPFVVACVGALAVGLVFNIACERVVYRPIATRAGTSALLTVLVAALGISIAGENVIRLVFSNSSQTVLGLDVASWRYRDVIVLNVEVYQVVSALLYVGLIWWVLARTDLGRTIKAVRANAGLAQLMGIEPDGVYLKCFALGSLVASVSAIWYALKFTVTPVMGFQPVLTAFVVAFLAGTARSPWRTLAAGVLVGLLEAYVVIWFDSAWSQLVVFVVLLAYLSARALDTQLIRQRLRRRVAGA